MGFTKRFNKRLVAVLLFFMLFALLFVIDQIYWYIQWNQKMELLGEALINQDIELMDEVFAPECEILTGNTESKYSYERETIEEVWTANDFNITAYKYGTMGWNPVHAQCAIEIIIIDTDGNKYSWFATLFVLRKSFSDCNINHIRYGKLRPVNSD